MKSAYVYGIGECFCTTSINFLVQKWMKKTLIIFKKMEKRTVSSQKASHSLAAKATSQDAPGESRRPRCQKQQRFHRCLENEWRERGCRWRRHCVVSGVACVAQVIRLKTEKQGMKMAGCQKSMRIPSLRKGNCSRFWFKWIGPEFVFECY